MESHLQFSGLSGKKIHLAVCGSIAAYKTLDLVRGWIRTGASVSVALTEAARKFVTPLSFKGLGASPVQTGMFDPGQDVLAHLFPSKEVDSFVIAPATADVISRLAHGSAADLVACQALAYGPSLILAPAMNPMMWSAPATQENIRILVERGAILVGPEKGEAACMDVGYGRLAEVMDIYLHGLRQLCPRDYAGKHVLVTLGPTREHWDPVRFWSNPSSGRMGASLAVAAWLRGAEVSVVSGPISLWLPPAITVHSISSAAQMDAKVAELWPEADFGLFCAAVCDFHPQPYGNQKFKKKGAESSFEINFSSNPDILNRAGGCKQNHQKILGFAAETSDLNDNMRDKLNRKNADVIVGNRIDAPDTGFQSVDNKVMVLDRLGRFEDWPVLPKTEISWRLLDWLIQI